MVWQLSAYSLFLGLAAVVSTAVAAVAWRRREKHGSPAFSVLMAGAALWAAGNTLQLTTTDLQLKLLFRTVAYVGHNVAPVALLVFALLYTGHGHWVTRRNVGFLALEPMVVALVATPANALGWHALVWTNSSLADGRVAVVLEQSFGPWYWVNTAYNYALVLIALYLFLYLALQSYAATRKQGFVLIVGVIPPFFANVAWIFDVTPIDFTPVAFTVTGLVFAVAIYRYRLFEVVPVARETVLDAVNDGYVVLDENDHVTDVNETARRHAAAVENPIGHPVGEVLPQCMDVVAEHRDRSGDGSRSDPVEGEVEIATDAGEPRYFEVQVSTISRARFTGRLVLLRNVTEQRTVTQWYQALIENASDVVAVIDERGRYTYHSPSSERVLGYEPAELDGESVAELIHPADRDDVLEKFERCVDEPEYQPSHEFRFRHGDGSWIWLESRARNHLDHPIIQGIVANSRDVTEQKAHEKTLRQQNERLQELASVAAHDLRNPLQVISGRLEHACETGDVRHFETIGDAVDRMETLIEDVLTLAREGDLVRQTEPVSLAAVAEAAWAGIDSAEARLTTDLEGLTIDADRSKLRSLFENLFANAVEHGGADVTVRVGETATGFFVEDDGDGIAPEARQRIFERGYSTEPGGSGLGLPIVRSIVTAHGWDVSLTEDAGWTRFEVTGVEAVADEVSADATRTDGG